MTLVERISDDTREALRGGDRPRLRVLRTLSSAIAYEAKDGRREPDDDLARTVLAREARRREEAVGVLRSGGRDDQVADEQAELAIIAEYLPPIVDPAAIAAAAREVLAETGATGPGDIGRVMGPLMVRLREQGTVDGKSVSATVRDLLDSP